MIAEAMVYSYYIDQNLTSEWDISSCILVILSNLNDNYVYFKLHGIGKVSAIFHRYQQNTLKFWHSSYISLYTIKELAYTL